MKKHHILIAFPSGDGAVSRHFRALSERLIARGHSVTCLVWGPKYDWADSGSTLEVLGWPSKRPTRLHDAVFLDRLIRLRHPECLIGNFAAVNLMLWIGWLRRVPLRIAWYHTVSLKADLGNMPAWEMKLQRQRKKLTYQLATHIVPVSTAVETEALQMFKVPQRKSHVFWNAIADPLSELDLGQIPHDPNLIVCVGELARLKGQDILIQAIPLLKNDYPDLRVRFLGDGSAGPEYEQLAIRLNVSQNCEFLGRVSREEVFRNFAFANVSVLASLNDACPCVIIESAAVGTPVVATNVGGIPEIIRDGIDGFLVPPNDPQVLAEKLGLLLGNPVLRDTMGQQARIRFLDAFEQKQAIDRQVEWLETLLNTHATKSC